MTMLDATVCGSGLRAPLLRAGVREDGAAPTFVLGLPRCPGSWAAPPPTRRRWPSRGGRTGGRQDELRDRYLAGARCLGVIRDGAAWFADEMPLNEFRLG